MKNLFFLTLFIYASACGGFAFSVVTDTSNIKVPLLRCPNALSRDANPDSIYLVIFYPGTGHHSTTFCDYDSNLSGIEAKSFIDKFVYNRRSNYLRFTAIAGSNYGDLSRGLCNANLIFFKRCQQTITISSFTKAPSSRKGQYAILQDNLFCILDSLQRLALAYIGMNNRGGTSNLSFVLEF